MKNKKIIDAYDTCTPSIEIKKSMLKHIMKQSKGECHTERRDTMKKQQFWKKNETVFTAKEKELIRKAIEMNELEDLEYMKNQEDLQDPHTFSPEFEQKMDALFAESNQRTEKKKMFSSVQFQKVAIAGIFAVLITVVSVGIHTESIPFSKFTYTQRKEEGAYAYLVEQEENLKDTIEEKYELTYVPKGYKVDTVQNSDQMYTLIFNSEKNNLCIYQQSTKQITTKIDDIFENYKEMVFDESKYYVMDRYDTKKIIWYSNGYQFFINADLPIEELVKMSKQIAKQ